MKNINSEQLEAIENILIIQKIEEIEKIGKRRKSCWVNPFLSKRHLNCLEDNLLKDLFCCERNEYQNFTRLSYEQFEEIFSLVTTYYCITESFQFSDLKKLNFR